MRTNPDKVRICLHFHTFLCNFFTFLNACFFVRICPHFLTFLCNFFSLLNARFSVKTSLINTKRGDFGDLGVLFLTMGINSC